MDQFCASLNVEKPGNDMWVEEIFYSEVSLESLVVEIVEILLYTIRITRLSE